MMEIVTVSLPYSVTILIIYRHYLLEGNLPVKYPSVPLSFMIETSQYLHHCTDTSDPKLLDQYVLYIR